VSGAHILLVEDESIVAIDVRNRLESLGYQVSAVAASGEEAVQKAEEIRPDLVLMDIVLKGEIDGVEASHQIQNRLDVPVIYLSAYLDDETLRRAQQSQPFGYLIKPYEESKLRAAIETALHRHHAETRLRKTSQWLGATLQCMSEAVIAADAGGRIKSMNGAAEVLTCWENTDALGRYLPIVFELQSGQTASLLERAQQLSRCQGELVPLPEGSVLTALNGRTLPIEGTLVPLVDEEGKFDGSVLAFRDISDRLKEEKVLHKSARRLRRGQRLRAICRMVGRLAHDCKNLAISVFGNISFARANSGLTNRREKLASPPRSQAGNVPSGLGARKHDRGS
jgi:PAS domain S-box-containing protein